MICYYLWSIYFIFITFVTVFSIKIHIRWGFWLMARKQNTTLDNKNIIWPSRKFCLRESIVYFIGWIIMNECYVIMFPIFFMMNKIKSKSTFSYPKSIESRWLEWSKPFTHYPLPETQINCIYFNIVSKLFFLRS